MRVQTAAGPKALLKRLHPRLAKWFSETFPSFTHAQLLCVPAVLDKRSMLLTSPTGSGKTLAGFVGVFDYLLRRLEATGRDGALRRPRTSQRDGPTAVQCIYISPLRALAYDIEKNLRAPVAGMGLEKDLSIHLRTGDTSPANRAKFRRTGAPFLVTTPESLAIMLAQESYVAHFRTCRFVIIDELHSFAGNKRGADLTISLERLERIRGIGNQDRDIAPRRPRTARPTVTTICRIGLSATAAPLDLLERASLRRCLFLRSAVLSVLYPKRGLANADLVLLPHRLRMFTCHFSRQCMQLPFFSLPHGEGRVRAVAQQQSRDFLEVYKMA